MADILIRGMEMPKNCLYCHFVSYDNDHCVVMDKDIPIYGTKPSWCPILHLPEKHGRLIDADALDRAFTDLRFNSDGTLNHWGDRPGWCMHGYEVEKLIADAPTIVPAEGGNADA